MRIVLASASPRRKDLLKGIGFDFEIIAAQGEEHPRSILPKDIVCELSRDKTEEVFGRISKEGDCIIIGADTTVAVDNEILGKPKDEADAIRMLQLLQGRTHEVYTGVTLGIYMNGEIRYHTFVEVTKVTFYPLDLRQIKSYIKTGESMDKAGAYGIQGRFMINVKGIEGEYANVVGLPVARMCRELAKEGFAFDELCFN